MTNPIGQGRGQALKATVFKNSTSENGQQVLSVHISSPGARCWDRGRTRKVGEVHLETGPLSKSPQCTGPSPGGLQSRGSHPLLKAARASPRTNTGNGAGQGSQSGRKGWAPRQRQPGRLAAVEGSSGGTGRSQLVHVKNSSRAGLSPSSSSSPSVLSPTFLHPSPSPSSSSSTSSSSGCSFSGELLTFREQGKQLRAGQGPGRSAGRSARHRGPWTRAVSIAGWEPRLGVGRSWGHRGAGKKEQR